jgi:hypothetical protein
LRRDNGWRRRNRLKITERAGTMGSTLMTPSAASFSALARGTMAIPAPDCTISFMVSILSATARMFGRMPRSANNDSTTCP